MTPKKYLYLLSVALLFSCATKQPLYKEDNATPQFTSLPNKTVENRIFLVGDGGRAKNGQPEDGVKAFQLYLQSQPDTKKDYTIYLGDNIYPDGLPDKKEEGRKQAEVSLNMQINAVKDYDGKTVFIPGNHDWYAEGLRGLKNQEKYIEDALGKNTFQPENGCPLETIDIGENIEIIIIDSQWYLEDWNNHPTINDECEIKTRDRFFLEIESALKKAQNKRVLFAMHHPMFTNGIHGGFYSAKKHLYPFQGKIPMPGLASLITQIRSQGGVSIQDRYNERYNNLMNRLETLLIGYDNVVVVSGHEHSLQYIKDEFVKQIVSGAASKQSEAALSENGLFSIGQQGFAELTIYKDGSAWVQFFILENNAPKLMFQKEVFPPYKTYDVSNLPESFPQTIEASVYTKEETERTDFFETIWGDHYRDMYSQKITVPVATLDTLHGGLEVVRKGGGHQTRSLRLKTKEGNEYNMRALKKSATQYLQTVLFKDKQIKDDFEQTNVEGLILDFYTSAHPYAFLAIPELSKAIDLLHPKPKLYYIPKHKALGEYNDEYGGELYMIEERPEENYSEERTFGYADDIESTHDIIAKIREDEKYKIDENAFIRARLFDMLIGDWDRHEDQWRWAQFDQPNGDKLYRPIPRDRDQVFSNFDGGLLDVMRFLSSSSKQLQVYDDNIDDGDLQWMNNAGVKLDRILIQNATLENWIVQAEYIQKNIDQEIMDKAFSALPEEVQDKTLQEIRGHFVERKKNLTDIAERYYKFLNELVILTGTDKDDYIDISRIDNGKTKIVISRNKDGKRGEVIVDRVFDKSITKEIWVYSLDDDDQFFVKEKANNPIKIRLIGGQNNDIYSIEEGRKIKVYDHKTKPNTVLSKNGADIHFTDFYNFNNFDYKKYNSSAGAFTPLLGFNPDDGILTGVSVTNTTYGFERNPFSTRHNFQFGYYFATSGFDLKYNGEYNVAQSWNLHVNARYTSNNFARNFFGFGNETVNNDDELDFDFNRVRTSIYDLKLGVLKKAPFGSDYGFGAIFEGIKLDPTANRFITQVEPNTDSEFYDRTFFAGLEAIFKYESFDNKVNPSRGMTFDVDLGAKTELGNADQTFGFLDSHLGFYNSISKNKKLVLKTDLRTQLRFGGDIIFYQAANIGGRTGLRGYRLQRFTGQNSLVGNADLRYSFDKFKTRALPLQIGIFAGYDVGRVWATNEDSNVWHNSYGGGFWVSTAESLAGTFNLFNSDDGLRFSFGFSFAL
ncbi:metallophosphoesterase [Winogradskyella litorisediminis]|uniref:Metallophosphoesterase n=1 Tax=Winogradskyella litorisediminis TaxID=1156618 RepID=A0ABW3N7G3_9FLAO